MSDRALTIPNTHINVESLPFRVRNMLHTLADTYRRSPGGTSLSDLPGFQRWVAESYRRLPYPVEYVEFDPYRSLDHMSVEVAATGRLLITTRNNESLFDPRVNLMFRAVHDFDHMRHHCNFGASGELKACKVISNRCGDEWGRALLFSEIVGQACVALVHGDFEEQKFVRYPLAIRDQALQEV